MGKKYNLLRNGEFSRVEYTKEFLRTAPSAPAANCAVSNHRNLSQLGTCCLQFDIGARTMFFGDLRLVRTTSGLSYLARFITRNRASVFGTKTIPSKLFRFVRS